MANESSINDIYETPEIETETKPITPTIYLSVEDGYLGFKFEGRGEITESDKPISQEIYDKFFEMQSSGRPHRVKDINGTTFEEIFEEMELEYIEPQPSPIEVLQEENKQLKAENEEIKEVLDNILMNLI